MHTVTLTKWGNSIGVRIPAAVIKQTNLSPGEELTIEADEKGKVTLTPVKDPQQGWEEAFNAIAKEGGDQLLIDLPNEFDEEEWTW